MPTSLPRKHRLVSALLCRIYLQLCIAGRHVVRCPECRQRDRDARTQGRFSRCGKEWLNLSRERIAPNTRSLLPVFEQKVKKTSWLEHLPDRRLQTPRGRAVRQVVACPRPCRLAFTIRPKCDRNARAQSRLQEVLKRRAAARAKFLNYVRRHSLIDKQVITAEASKRG
jgi:hypothetical protein